MACIAAMALMDEASVEMACARLFLPPFFCQDLCVSNKGTIKSVIWRLFVYIALLLLLRAKFLLRKWGRGGSAGMKQN